MKKSIKIGIVGAGIGGLVVARFLKEKGYEVQIFERGSSVRSNGAGIILACNATQILKELQLYPTLFENGNELNDMNITDENLDILMGNDIAAFEEEFKVKNIAIKREVLHDILMKGLEDDITVNKELLSIKEHGEESELIFKDGSSELCDLVVGADGINSKVRSYVNHDFSIRDAKQICWRGLVSFDLPSKYSQSLNEAWGKEKRFGFVNLGGGIVYWYALANSGSMEEKQTSANLAKMFNEFNPIVSQILNATSTNDIITGAIKDLQPIKSWFKNNVCLMGDAAHATTPNLGQGACQAIESGYALAQSIDKFEDPNLAFKYYQNVRMKKAHMVTDTSWKIGKMAHMKNDFFRKFRNFGMKMTPDKMSHKKNQNLFTIK